MNAGKMAVHELNEPLESGTSLTRKTWEIFSPRNTPVLFMFMIHLIHPQT